MPTKRYVILRDENDFSDPLAHLVNHFSAALLEKLRAAEVKYGRHDDWLDPNWKADCQRKLVEHVAKGDPLDVAAYAAFCWHHGWITMATPPCPECHLNPGETCDICGRYMSDDLT